MPEVACENLLRGHLVVGQTQVERREPHLDPAACITHYSLLPYTGTAGSYFPLVKSIAVNINLGPPELAEAVEKQGSSRLRGIREILWVISFCPRNRGTRGSRKNVIMIRMMMSVDVIGCHRRRVD